MIAQVVPITRLRRSTTWWSYTVPRNFTCLPGSLVIVPFRGHPTLGVVWHIEKEDSKATQSLSEVVTPTPLIRTAQREIIQYLSEIGFCSLSTSLYQWLPAELRSLPLNAATRILLAEYTASNNAKAQHLILVPSSRFSAEQELRKKYGTRFASLFQNENSLQDWFAIGRGEISVALGREKALTAPWLNLRTITIIEPEDTSYYHDQTPYCSLLLPVQKLAELSHLSIQYRSFVPAPSQWPQNTPLKKSPIEIVDLRIEKVLNPTLLTAIKQTLQSKKQVLILYNAHDRLNKTQDSTLKLVPGIETLSKQLAAALGVSELPASIIFDSRKLFQRAYTRVGLTVVLSLDPLTNQENYANLLQGIGDLGHLFEYEAPCLIQSSQLNHPLVHALRNQQLELYVESIIKEQQEKQLPPFGQYIVCTVPEDYPELMATHTKLQELCQPPWQIGYPTNLLQKRKKLKYILLFTPDLTSRIPVNLRAFLAALPRPWKIQYNPPDFG